MKMKKLTALLLTAVMGLSTLAGCGEEKTASDSVQKESGDAGANEQGSEPVADVPEELITIDIFDAAANYQGIQSGWFAKVIKDRFNMELNIIAPQVAGDAIYQTRASSGNLGDIVLLENLDFKDCVEAGLIRDFTDKYDSCENLKRFDDPIRTLNANYGDGSKIYGIPTEMTGTSPTSYSQDVIYSSPMLRWDLYSELGCPEIKDLDGLLDVLEQMMKAHPTNDAGDKAYPLSLWADWDGGDGMLGIANVVQLTTWYGEKIKGSAILKPDNTFTQITDKNATYYKLLKFLYTANKRGLVDPDSGTQVWDTACAKMSAGQVYLMWYSWQVGFWNSQDRLKDGSAFIFIPVTDQKYYADSDSYFGSGRVFGVGSGVEGEKYDRIMKFLDWYASPEGVVFQHDGIEGFNYSVMDNGKFKVERDDALMNNVPVPEEYGGAGYQDGNNQINQWIVSGNAINPNTGEMYASTYWSSYKEETMTDMKKAWQEKFGADEPVNYMKNNDVLVVSPSVSVSLPNDTSEISVIRNQCNKELCDASWRMIFAKDEAEFDKMWSDLATKLDGMGFQDLYKFDCEKHQIEVDAKVAATK